MKNIFITILLSLIWVTPCYSAYELMSSFTEDDPGGYVTIDATKVTATNMANDELTQVYYDGGYREFTGSQVRLKVSISSVNTMDVAILALSNATTQRNNWTDGLIVGIGADQKIYIKDVFSTDTDTLVSAMATDSTPYYLEFRRHSYRVTVKVYSDAAYSTLIDTITISATYGVSGEIKGYDGFSNLFVLQSGAVGSGAPTWVDTEHWTSLSGTTVGTCTPTNLEITSSTYLHSVAGLSTICGKYRDLSSYFDDSPSAEDTHTFEVRNKISYLGTATATAPRAHFIFQTGEYSFHARVFSDYIGVRGAGAVWDDTHAETTSTGTWYTWRFVIDQSGGSPNLKIYRKEDAGSFALINEWTNIYAYTGQEGYIYSAYGNSSSGTSQDIEEDYIKYAVGLSSLSIEANVVVDEVEVFRFTKTMYRDLNEFADDHVSSHDGETVTPTGWTSNAPAGSTVATSTDWASTGTYSLKISETTAGNAHIYDDVSGDSDTTDETWLIGGTFRLGSMADGDVMGVVSGKVDTSTYSTVEIHRSGSDYYWRINGTDTDYTLSPATDYRIQLINRHYSTNFSSMGSYVDDMTAILIDGEYIGYVDTLSTTDLDTVYLGSVDTASRGVRYYDNWYARQNHVFALTKFVRLPNGNMVLNTTDRDLHSELVSQMNPHQMISDDSGETWRLNDGNYTLGISTGWWSHSFHDTSGNVYALVVDYSGTSNDRVLKSTDDGVTWSNLAPSNQPLYTNNERWGYRMFPSGDYLYGTYNYLNPSDNSSTPYNTGTIYATDDTATYSGTCWRSKVDSNIRNTPSEGIYWTSVGSICGRYGPSTSYFMRYNISSNQFEMYDTVATSWVTTLPPSNPVVVSTADANNAPNESSIFRNKAGDLVMITRWDKHNTGTLGKDHRACTYSISTDEGASWSAVTKLEPLWGNKNASVTVTKVGDLLIMSGRQTYRGSTGVLSTSMSDNFISTMSADMTITNPLEIINEAHINYSDQQLLQGNGNSHITQDGQTIYLTSDNGSSGFYVYSEEGIPFASLPIKLYYFKQQRF